MISKRLVVAFTILSVLLVCVPVQATTPQFVSIYPYDGQTVCPAKYNGSDATVFSVNVTGDVENITVNYYIDAWNGVYDYYGMGQWNNLNDMVDSNPSSNADGDTTNFCSDVPFGTDCDSSSMNDTTHPINKVEISIFGYQQAGVAYVDIYPEFTGPWGTEGSLYQIPLDLTFNNVWSAKVDITYDAVAPATWTWADIENLGVRIETAYDGLGTQIFVGMIAVNVTYSGIKPIDILWFSYMGWTQGELFNVLPGTYCIVPSEYVGDYAHPVTDFLCGGNYTYLVRISNDNFDTYEEETVTFTINCSNCGCPTTTCNSTNITVQEFLTNCTGSYTSVYDPDTGWLVNNTYAAIVPGYWVNTSKLYVGGAWIVPPNTLHEYDTNTLTLNQQTTNDDSPQINAITSDDTFVYIAVAGVNLSKYWKSNLTLQQVAPYGGNVYSLLVDDNYLFVGHDSGINSFWKSNLTFVAWNSYGPAGTITSMTQDDDYVYAVGVGIPGNNYIVQYLKTDLSFIADSSLTPHDSLYGITAAPGGYLYIASDVDGIWKYWASNLTEIMNIAADGTRVVVNDSNYIYSILYTGLVWQLARLDIVTDSLDLLGDTFATQPMMMVADNDFLYFDVGASVVWQAWKSNLTSRDDILPPGNVYALHTFDLNSTWISSTGACCNGSASGYVITEDVTYLGLGLFGVLAAAILFVMITRKPNDENKRVKRVRLQFKR